MSEASANVLIIDDDPEHLRIYGLIIQRAGYSPVLCLVRQSGPELAPEIAVDMVLLDYMLRCSIPTSEIAAQVRRMWPDAPIVLLSDVLGLPPEMQSRVTCFVRKGEPAKLTAVVKDLLGSGMPAFA